MRQHTRKTFLFTKAAFLLIVFHSCGQNSSSWERWARTDTRSHPSKHKKKTRISLDSSRMIVGVHREMRQIGSEIGCDINPPFPPAPRKAHRAIARTPLKTKFYSSCIVTTFLSGKIMHARVVKTVPAPQASVRVVTQRASLGDPESNSTQKRSVIDI